MNTSKELSVILDEMITAGNTLAKAAKALKELYFSSEEESKTEASKKKETPEVPSKAEVKKEPSKNIYSYEEVRKICAAKSVQEDGRHKREVIDTIKKYANGQSLSKVSPSDYAALVAEIEVIGNAK